MKNEIIEILKELFLKYKLKNIKIQKEYATTKKENYKHRGCCMEADVKARMDEIQEIYMEIEKILENNELSDNLKSCVGCNHIANCNKWEHNNRCEKYSN